nr:hypothetical protein [Tanacetum cinerariifolium]
MSQDVITVGSTMRILLLYRGEYSQWRERFMNYLEEWTDGEAMINSIQNGDQPLPIIAQVSLVGTAQDAPPTLKDPKFWTTEEKNTRKIDHLARSLLIQGLLNDIYSFIDNNETAKYLWDALERQMRGSKYGEQDRKAAILYEYETFKANEGEQLLDTHLQWKQYGTRMRQTKNLMDINIDALYNILKENQGDVIDALGYKKKAVMVTSDPLALVAEKMNVSKQKKKVVVSSDSEGGEFVKSDDKKEDKKADEKKRDMSKVKCYNCKKKGHFAKDCKKAKVKDYNYYKTKMLLAKKDYDEQVLLTEDQAWMKSSGDSDQEINANMVFMAQIEKIDSPFQQTSSLKPYVSTVILEKIIIDLEDEVVSLLEKENANLKTIESLKTKDTFSSVRRPKNSGVIWKKKGSSNTSTVDLSAVSLLNKNVKRYSRKDLLM